MITTSVEGVKNPIVVKVLTTVVKCSINFYRTNWFESNKKMFRNPIDIYKNQFKALNDLNKECNSVDAIKTVLV
ncbi:hypothetical protein [Algibacter pectinivorans]|uniref:Uncharacterized protein n=1 Tax=Algibacter pectinivorans TaxID=870482 RepID=A0A1I1PSG1_9FLAO|nr:hypothetical protein [Algibacter pectinivorans]SFD10538.1 hypothetical protein SAMN04487987_10417 [Algibacter pectinivorans]